MSERPDTEEALAQGEPAPNARAEETPTEDRPSQDGPTQDDGEPTAASRHPDADETGRSRLWHSVLRPSRGQAVVAVLLAVLAFAAVTQVRLNSANDVYAGMRQSDLVQTLNGLSAASRRAEADVARLQNTRDSLTSSSQRRAAALTQARTELNTLRVLAGTAPAVGPGVKVTVDSPQDNLSLNYLLDGVEELRDAGAEAMQINHSVRVVAQTSFEDTDHGISVDGRTLNSPFVIEVIGDPDNLSTALNFEGGFIDDVTFNHQGTVKVEKLDKVDVNVTRNPTTPHYAHPASQ
jgi:uncharacterized protein YlxW (UPF0749 family)